MMKSSLLLGENLCDLGIISPETAKDEAKLHAACSEFCPHHVAHYLGMDVHDTGTYTLLIWTEKNYQTTPPETLDMF